MKNGKTLSAAQVRSGFIDFFRERKHTFVASSSLLPAEDPTLLFTNAGMNQFKDIFLGREKRDYVRVANSQKCIRAGGKHNDLEDVGHDTYHHTFFEMLGNWSFGDYFKEDAIRWAWELLTKVWGLPKERLHATVFEGDPALKLAPDDEAADLWRKVTDIDPSHIHLGNKKDNFWEMGDTGPCGPCSEIHYDFTPDLSGGPLVNAGDARVIEIWNLVFMQFNRKADGGLDPLPAKHVDTGMGLERVCRILQGVDSNYDIDVFSGLFAATAEFSKAGPYTGKLEDIKDIAYRVVADHARALSFAIADGIIPSNEGRGYVLRRILRRAARYGRQYLQIEGPFISKLVPTVAQLMGDAFPEVRQRQKVVAETIAAEEESFGRTLDRGIESFNKAYRRAIDRMRGARPVQYGNPSVESEELSQVISDWESRKKGRVWYGKAEITGHDAFELYATFGFPIDLTQLMAKERRLSVDMAGYEKEMAEHREVSAGEGDKFKVDAIQNLPSTDAKAKYSFWTIKAKVLGFVRGTEYVTQGELAPGEAAGSPAGEAAVVLDRTNFYGEQGGQAGDCGKLTYEGGEFAVRTAMLAGECVLHVGQAKGAALRVGMQVTARIDHVRRDIMRNHTATHLLNWALRKVLGDHVNQAGSVVAPDRLRFDFTHNQALTAQQLAEVERMVNQKVLDDVSVVAGVMPLEQARQIPGVRAVFGEKYPDPVRVIVIGSAEEGAPAGAPVERSAEFCGGTHLDRTGQVGPFKIVAEESVAKGVRRITAFTGMAAVRHIQEIDEAARHSALLLRVSVADVPARVEAMQKELKQLRKSKAGAAGDALSVTAEVETHGGKIVVGRLDGAEAPDLRTACDVQRQKGASAIFLGALTQDKITLVAMVSDELAKAGKLKAGDWVKAIAPLVGGSGGGKPTLAQAGGRDAEKLPDALQQAAAWARERLG